MVKRSPSLGSGVTIYGKRKPKTIDWHFRSILEIVLSNLNSIGSVWIFVLTLLINADAFGRKLFHSPIDGVNEIVELSIVGIVFLQLGMLRERGDCPVRTGFSI